MNERARVRGMLKSMYLAGEHISEIAKATGLTEGSVKVIASRMGLKRGHTRKAVEKPKPFERIKFVGHDRYEVRWGGY